MSERAGEGRAEATERRKDHEQARAIDARGFGDRCGPADRRSGEERRVRGRGCRCTVERGGVFCPVHDANGPADKRLRVRRAAPAQPESAPSVEGVGESRPEIVNASAGGVARESQGAERAPGPAGDAAPQPPPPAEAPSEAIEEMRVLCAEIWHAHREIDNPEYNECELNECDWCYRTRLVLARLRAAPRAPADAEPCEHCGCQLWDTQLICVDCGHLREIARAPVDGGEP